MSEVRRYIHYGHSSFDRNLFIPIRNQERWVKPHGGLWASSVDAGYGWKDWCISNGFKIERLVEYFEFTLSDDTRVLHIYDVAQLSELPQIEGPDMWCCLDFEQLLSDGYGAVELHLSEEKRDKLSCVFAKGLYWELYGWDCDSILIMNPDVVEVV